MDIKQSQPIREACTMPGGYPKQDSAAKNECLSAGPSDSFAGKVAQTKMHAPPSRFADIFAREIFKHIPLHEEESFLKLKKADPWLCEELGRAMPEVDLLIGRQAAMRHLLDGSALSEDAQEFLASLKLLDLSGPWAPSVTVARAKNVLEVTRQIKSLNLSSFCYLGGYQNKPFMSAFFDALKMSKTLVDLDLRSNDIVQSMDMQEPTLQMVGALPHLAKISLMDAEFGPWSLGNSSYYPSDDFKGKLLKLASQRPLGLEIDAMPGLNNENIADFERYVRQNKAIGFLSLQVAPRIPQAAREAVFLRACDALGELEAIRSFDIRPSTFSEESRMAVKKILDRNRNLEQFRLNQFPPNWIDGAREPAFHARSLAETYRYGASLLQNIRSLKSAQIDYMAHGHLYKVGAAEMQEVADAFAELTAALASQQNLQELKFVLEGYNAECLPTHLIADVIDACKGVKRVSLKVNSPYMAPSFANVLASISQLSRVEELLLDYSYSRDRNFEGDALAVAQMGGLRRLRVGASYLRTRDLKAFIDAGLSIPSLKTFELTQYERGELSFTEGGPLYKNIPDAFFTRGFRVMSKVTPIF